MWPETQRCWEESDWLISFVGAIRAVAELKKEGYQTILLTDDHAEVGSAIGQQLGVDEAIGEILPELSFEV